MVGQEIEVGRSHVPGWSREGATHRDLTVSLVDEAGHRVSACSERMASVGGERSLGRTGAFDAQADAVRLPQTVCALSARIGAVHPSTPWQMSTQHHGAAARTIVPADDRSVGWEGSRSRHQRADSLHDLDRRAGVCQLAGERAN